jgi:hypothetical protein
MKQRNDAVPRAKHPGYVAQRAARMLTAPFADSVGQWNERAAVLEAIAGRRPEPGDAAEHIREVVGMIDELANCSTTFELQLSASTPEVKDSSKVGDFRKSLDLLGTRLERITSLFKQPT